jgi:hypothetical protein
MYFYVAEHSAVLTTVQIVDFFPVNAILMYRNLTGQCNEPEAAPYDPRDRIILDRLYKLYCRCNRSLLLLLA